MTTHRALALTSLCAFTLGCPSGEAQVEDSPDGAIERDAEGTGADASAPGDASAPPEDAAAPPDGGREDAGGDLDSGGREDAGEDTGGEVDAGAPAPCDYRAVDRIVVIEAETLPLVEDWAIRSDDAGFTGSGYIRWEGRSRNNDPTHGVMEVAIAITEPGRYRFQWHNRIGMGDDPTEHNDTWVQFPGSAAYYGVKNNSEPEERRYPKPLCEDAAAMAAVAAAPEVAEAVCPEGSTRDGWLKVYSSGARDWRWSTNTSDNDASRVLVEFDAPGVYTLSLAARGDFHQIDRIVLHDDTLADADVRDLTLPETACP